MTPHAAPPPAATLPADPTANAAASQPARAPQATPPANQPPATTVQAERLSELARQQVDGGSLDAAEDLLRQALDADPLFQPARLQLAILLQRRGRVADAIHEYETLLATHPDNTTAWRNVALAYMTARDYPKARVTLQKLLAIKPRNPQTYLDLGDVEMLSGRPDAAKQYWLKARSLSTPNSDVAARATKRLKVYVR